MAKLSRVELFKRGIEVVKSGKTSFDDLDKAGNAEVAEFMKKNGSKLRFDLFKQDVLTKIVDLEKALEVADIRAQTYLTNQIKEVINSMTYFAHDSKNEIFGYKGVVEDVRDGMEGNGNSRLSTLASKLKG
jgi:hypothetical protein